MTPDGQHNASYSMATIFDPISYFDGRFYAHGVFIDRSKQIRRRFTADIFAHATENKTDITESFKFDDGETEQRIWTLTRLSGTRIEGVTEDLSGKAIGMINGPTLHMRYDFFLNISGRRIKFAFDDMMICQDQDHLLNKARISKFGFYIGELVISFTRV